MIGMLGLLGGLALLILLALRGVNIILASLLCTLIVIATNGLPLASSLNDAYAFGDLGAFTFAGRFFLLFTAGAIFGRVMDESHAATSIAMSMVRALGAHQALWITVFTTALLTYGGVVVFVVIFAMYPLGLRLMKESNIPKRLFLAAMALGSGTFTLTALPGTPSIHNVIPTVTLGTDLFAAAWLGLFGGALMLLLGIAYLGREQARASAAGEGFVPAPGEHVPDLSDIDHDLPPWPLAFLPLVLVIGTILAPRLLPLVGLGADWPLVQFANTQPILWPSIALVFASLVALVLFSAVRRAPLAVLGRGAQDAVTPLMATSVVIGFGGVVVTTEGFTLFAQTMVNADLPPLLSMFAAISVVSGIVGSASGGLQIFMATLADSYLAMGIDPQELHRLVAMAAGGIDSLPHCGAIIAMLTITKLSHREGYKDVGIITVVIPVIAALASIGMAMLF